MIATIIAPEFEQFVSDEVAAGKYRSAEEVVSEGLRLLREREIEALRKKIDVGLEQVDRGEVVDIGDEKSHEAFLGKKTGRNDLTNRSDPFSAQNQHRRISPMRHSF
jgi:antitoxin ParD1/3/4